MLVLGTMMLAIVLPRQLAKERDNTGAGVRRRGETQTVEHEEQSALHKAKGTGNKTQKKTAVRHTRGIIGRPKPGVIY